MATYRQCRNGHVYGVIRVPTDLAEHPQLIGKSPIRKSLGLKDTDDPVDIEVAVQSFVNDYRAYFDALRTSNSANIDLITKAKALLKVNNLKAGDLVDRNQWTPEQNQAYQAGLREELDRLGVFNDLSHWYSKKNHQQTQTDENNSPLPSRLAVQDMAWTLLEKPQIELQVHSLHHVWQHYVDRKSIDTASIDGKRMVKRWSKFEKGVDNEQTLLTNPNINKALKAYVASREGQVSSATISRELGQPIIAALNLYIDDNDLDNIVVKRPKVMPTESKIRPAVDTEPHRAIFDNALTMEDSWVKLALLIQLQSSVINSELQNLTRVNLKEQHGVTYLLIKDGKTTARERAIPIVVETEEIKRLAELLDDGEGYLMPLAVRRTTGSNQVHQINRVLKKHDKALSSYSLRHTWKSKAEAADISQTWIDRLGGWQVKNKSREYGGAAIEFKDNLLRAAEVQRKVNRHLLTGGKEPASANLYSLIETAKANGKEPYSYLSWLFEKLPGADLQNIESLMPWNMPE